MLALVATIGGWLVVGSNLGLLFVVVVLATLLIPPLCLCEDAIASRLLVSFAVVDGISLGVLICTFNTALASWDLVDVYMVLVAWGFALVSIATLSTATFPSQFWRIPGAAFTTVIGLLWLSWPVWLAAALPHHPQLTSWLVAPHPILTINGVLREQGIWTQRPIAYRYLVTLGQDVPYELPESIWPMVVVHGAVAVVLLGASRVGSRWTLRSTNHTEAAASTNIVK